MTIVFNMLCPLMEGGVQSKLNGRFIVAVYRETLMGTR